jgi:hypothetical protein
MYNPLPLHHFASRSALLNLVVTPEAVSSDASRTGPGARFAAPGGLRRSRTDMPAGVKVPMWLRILGAAPELSSGCASRET